MNRRWSEPHARWMEACRAPHSRLTAALLDCKGAQERVLWRILGPAAGTLFGQRHGFASLRTIDDFRHAVPVRSYEDLRPYVDRIRRDEKGVLTADPVTRLHLSSGSSGASKLLPFTAGLRRGFQAGVQPWLYDLYSRYPGLRRGAFFWIVSPPGAPTNFGRSAVPIGFADDAEYLDPVGRLVFPRISAAGPVPEGIGVDEFYVSAWTALLGAPALSMISFWSPRFFIEMLERLSGIEEEVLQRVHDGGRPARAARLSRLLAGGAGSAGLGSRLWPELSLVSCWTDSWAALFAEELRSFFGDIPIEPKGLLATEGIVSVPWGDGAPGAVLAALSHFFEFEAADGSLLLAQELTIGGEYQVVLTTQGGLYRVRLGDVVRVVGREHSAPRLQFVARAGGVVDLCGEKLSEAYVCHVLSAALRGLSRRPEPCFLAPRTTRRWAGYALVVSGGEPGELKGLCAVVERGLERNFYYRHARRLGQLSPLELSVLSPAVAARHVQGAGPRGPLGTAKPRFLWDHWPLARETFCP